MDNLMKLFKAYSLEKRSLSIDISWNSTLNWCMYINYNQNDEVIFRNNHVSLEVLSSQAFLALAEWGREYEELENIVYNIF